MAKPSSTSMLASSALCFLSLLRFAHCQDDATAAGAATVSEDGRLQVEGMVYCDSCHVQKITTISGMIAGAKVKLECKGSGGTKSYEGMTDQYGNYHVQVEGKNDVCEISLVSSGDPNCAAVSPNSRVTLNLKDDQGMVAPKRVADPISFMIKAPLPNCAEILKQETQVSQAINIIPLN